MRLGKLLIGGTFLGLMLFCCFASVYGKPVTTKIYATISRESGPDSTSLAAGDQLVFMFSYDDAETEMHSFNDDGSVAWTWNLSTDPDCIFLSDADYSFSANIDLAIQEAQYDTTSKTHKSQVYDLVDFIEFLVHDDNFDLSIKDYINPSKLDTGQLYLYGNDYNLITDIILTDIRFSTTSQLSEPAEANNDLHVDRANYSDINNPGQADSDGDGISDAYDVCPDNQNKIDPGAHGCNDYISPGTNIEVSVCGVINIIFDEVASGGFVECVEIPTASANVFKSSSTGTKFKAVSNVYDIAFTGTFNGFVTVCFGYNESIIKGNEENLRLYYCQAGSEGENLTTLLDLENNIICGETTQFSEFGLVELVE